MTAAAPTWRWLRWLGLGAAIVAIGAVLVVGVLLLRVRGVLAGRSEELVDAVGRAVGLPIRAQDVEVSWWPPGATAHDVEIPDETPYGPGDLVRMDEARIEVAFLPLLRGEIVVTEVRLVSPVLFVVRGVDGGWNVGTRPARDVSHGAGESSLAGPTPAVVIDSIRVRNARLVYRDRAIPGLGELEVKSVDALLRRRGDLYRVTFNAQALGAAEDNVEGSILLPRDGAPAKLHMSASGLGGARLPELIALLRGTMPFGIVLGGELAATLDAEVAAVWPPSGASGRLTLDAGAATLEAAGGWVMKPAGRPLAVDLALRAGSYGLAVDHAAVASGDVRLVANLATQPSPDAGQQPLLLALEGLDATRLAAWMPALAALRPQGSLVLEGKVVPGPQGVATDLRVATSRLALEEAGRVVTVSSASLDLAIAPGTSGVLGALRLAELQSQDGTIASLAATVAGGASGALDVQVEGTRLARNGVVLDRLGIGLVVRDRDTEIRTLKIVGLGGELSARGRVLRDRDGVFTAALQPEWSQLDLSRLVGLLGETDAGRGTFSGRASLETSGATLDAALANLNGAFELRLGDGALSGLNVARVTLASLDGIPRLGEAIEGRARDRLPELLAETSDIGVLRIDGTVNEGRIQIGELRLEARHYAIDAHGRVTFAGDTDLDGTLILTLEASRSLLSGAGVLQALGGGDEQVRIPIAVRGVYPDLRSRPSKDYLADVAARGLGGAGRDRAAGFLRRLLGGQE